MSSLQERLATVTDMQFAAIAAAANLKSQLSELGKAARAGQESNGNWGTRNDGTLRRYSCSQLGVDHEPAFQY